MRNRVRSWEYTIHNDEPKVVVVKLELVCTLEEASRLRDYLYGDDFDVDTVVTPGERTMAGAMALPSGPIDGILEDGG